jgi:DNA (cytosine-5)-methyltransferase 1
MARCGLGSSWKCLFANDFDHKKSMVYRYNWKVNDLKTADIRTVTAADLPGVAELAWGSFPCQDLSLAGGGAGLKGERSGTFYPFWDVMRGLIAEDRAPRIIALENVCGALTSHEGRDFSAICSAFDDAGYRYGALVVDAELFVPHSRPRLFFIGVHHSVSIPSHLVSAVSQTPWHPRSIKCAKDGLPKKAALGWVWWKLPIPRKRTLNLSDLIEEDPKGVEWHTATETAALIGMMSDVNLAKLEEAKKLRRRVVGAIYKRTRHDESGQKVQRAEVRFDDVSGCLRTPAGGSSRQLLLIVDGEDVRSRLISARETARLMGLPDSFVLPSNYNEAYHLTGDGVAVPVVRHLARHLFEPILAQAGDVSRIAA